MRKTKRVRVTLDVVFDYEKEFESMPIGRRSVDEALRLITAHLRRGIHNIDGGIKNECLGHEASINLRLDFRKAGPNG